MGRYGNNGEGKPSRSRYGHTDGRLPSRRKKSEVNTLLIGMLVLAAIAGGFFLLKLSGNLLESDSIITSFLDKTIGSAAPRSSENQGQPSDKSGAETKSTANALGLVHIEKPRQDTVLPELDSSDDSIREALIALTPEITPYLATGQIIRNYMQIANDFSQGTRVAKHISFIKLAEPFSVLETDGKLIISEKSYHRYDNLAQAIASVSISDWLAIYKKFRPLMLQVFSEFSYPEGHNLDDVVIGAAKQILSAPVIEKPLKVNKRSVLYKYDDPELEALNPVHKQMLRMGPANTRVIQNKLAEFVAELVNPKPDGPG